MALLDRNHDPDDTKESPAIGHYTYIQLTWTRSSPASTTPVHKPFPNWEQTAIDGGRLKRTWSVALLSPL